MFELKLVNWLALHFNRTLDLLIRAQIPSTLSEFLGLEDIAGGGPSCQRGGELGYQWSTYEE